jgi:hypothetical protein
MKSIINLLLLLFLCFSCSKEEDLEYEPYIKGSIVGFAMLTDQYGNFLDDHSGITVYTEPGRKYAGKTDINGRFEIKSVPTGTYNLSFEKEGFGTMKYAEVHHLGGQPTVLGIPTSDFPYRGRIVLHENITLRITNIVPDGNFIRVDLEYFGTPLMDYVDARLFFSTSDGFSIEDAGYVSDVSSYNEPKFYFELSDLPFESGTTVYCKGSLFTYGVVTPYVLRDFFLVDSYHEPSGTTVYPNITEESDQYAFVLP